MLHERYCKYDVYVIYAFTRTFKFPTLSGVFERAALFRRAGGTRCFAARTFYFYDTLKRQKGLTSMTWCSPPWWSSGALSRDRSAPTSCSLARGQWKSLPGRLQDIFGVKISTRDAVTLLQVFRERGDYVLKFVARWAEPLQNAADPGPIPTIFPGPLVTKVAERCVEKLQSRRVLRPFP